MSIKDKWVTSKPTEIIDNAVENAKESAADAAEKGQSSVTDAAGEMEKYAEQKAKEEAAKGADALQQLVEDKVKDVIQELGASPEDAEKVVALAKENIPDEAKSAVADAAKKLL